MENRKAVSKGIFASYVTPPLSKAYLNYVVFNQNFVKVTEGHEQINGAPYSNMPISLNNITINQKGYIYVWVSNESNANLDVFFDDLKVTHTKGHILQEDHYYPFGLSINALSSSVPLTKPNRFKYNGKELQEEFDLNWYDYGARMYNPTIGKWNAIDPMSEFYLNQSPYHYALNNPVRYLDPNGMYSTEQWKKDHGLTDDDFTSLEVASSSSAPKNNQDNGFLIEPYDPEKHGKLDERHSIELEYDFSFGRDIKDDGLTGYKYKIFGFSMTKIILNIYLIEGKIVIDHKLQGLLFRLFGD